jgi:uncharacterized membrane protein YdjX (TVP38/TMEM64 family)
LTRDISKQQGNLVHAQKSLSLSSLRADLVDFVAAAVAEEAELAVTKALEEATAFVAPAVDVTLVALVGAALVAPAFILALAAGFLY